MFDLRDYQADAVNEALSDPGLIIAGPGSGKTAMAAEMSHCLRASGARVLVVTHSQELVAQNAGAIAYHTGHEPSVLAGALGRREVGGPVVVANIASAHRHRRKLIEAGSFDVAIIDEAHRHNPKGKQYAQTIDAMRDVNPNLTMIGLTGSPWRAGHGFIAAAGKGGQDPIWPRVSHEVPTQMLIDEGHLVPVRGRRADERIDLSSVSVDNTGDYRTSQLREAVDDAVTARCIAELSAYSEQSGRRRMLAYGVDVEHCHVIAAEMGLHGIRAAVISAYTPTKERRGLVHAYRIGALDCLVSVAALAVGFDAPDVNLICMLRPTRSPALFAQIWGRGARPFECPATGIKKLDCTVLDYGGSVLMHGSAQSIDWRNCDPPRRNKQQPAVWACPECETYVPMAEKVCVCGYVKPKPKVRAERVSPEKRIRKDDAALQEPPIRCTRLRLDTHVSKAGRITVKWAYGVDGHQWPVSRYTPLDSGQMMSWFEAIWLEHGGSHPVPRTPQTAVARQSELVKPMGVCVTKNGDYLNLKSVHYAGDPALTMMAVAA